MDVSKLTDDGRAPEILADELAGLYLLNGLLRLTFAAHHVDHTTDPGPVSRVVTGRVALTVPAARQMRDALNQFVGRIEAQAEKAAANPVEH